MLLKSRFHSQKMTNFYLITKFKSVTRAWGGSWADCVSEGLVVRRAIYHWEPCEIILVQLCADNTTRHLERIFSCPKPIEITPEEIEAAIQAALKTTGNFAYIGRNKKPIFLGDI